MNKLLEEVNSDSTTKSVRLSTTGKILLGLTGGLAVGLTVISAPFISPALRKYCLPFIPATNTQVENILVALRNRKGTLLDLGSGDGRVVFEAAKKGFVSHGVELNPWLVLYCNIQAYLKGLNKNTKFLRQDLWKFELSRYDNIVIFGVEQMMSELEKKFREECKNDCNVIACRFPLPSIKPSRTIGHGIDTVWVYEKFKA